MRWMVIFMCCFFSACSIDAKIETKTAPMISFEVGDCLKFTGNYEYPEQEFPAKLIVSLVHSQSYVTYDFQDKELSKPIVLRFSTAQEFKKVQCNQ